MHKIVNNSPADKALAKLSFSFEKLRLYNAGLPRYSRPFTRDTIISALLSNNLKMLSDFLQFAAKLQGTKKDPKTGEEQGKIFHEYDFKLNGAGEVAGRPGLTKLYNSCDSTALFLIGHQKYRDETGDFLLSRSQFSNIALAADYILRHLNSQNRFEEDPKFSDAKEYALRVTYWKDSVLVDRVNGEPQYPVLYPLSQVQNLAGLRAGAKLLQSEYLFEKAEEMKEALVLLFDKNIKNFPVAIDAKGAVSVVSSDGLNALFYLNPGDLDASILEDIIESSKILETKLGYKTLEDKASRKLTNQYHGNTLWTHEQAQIHMAATRHLEWAKKNKDLKLSSLLLRVREVSFRVYKYLSQNKSSFPEIFNIEGDKIVPGGCDPQLWAIAAKKYFDEYSKFRQEKETLGSFLV